MNATLLGRGLLLFWSLWLSIVFGSNLADGLRAAGILPEAWSFASGNFALIGSAIGIYALGKASAVVFFTGVVALQLAASLLFWRAWLDPRAIATPGQPKIVHAFTAAIALFAGFLVADELFIVYDRLPALETTHLLVLCALLLSRVVIAMPGDGARAE